MDEPDLVISQNLDPEAKHIWISDLKAGATAQDIEKVFMPHLSVISGKVVQKQANGEIQAFAFMTLSTAQGKPLYIYFF